MMAMKHDRPVCFAGQRHVFLIGFSAFSRAIRASYPSRFVEVELLYKLSVHFMLPLLLRLNERFLAGD